MYPSSRGEDNPSAGDSITAREFGMPNREAAIGQHRPPRYASALRASSSFFTQHGMQQQCSLQPVHRDLDRHAGR